MRKCPKCQMVYTDASKICRACGSIIDEVAEETPASVADDSSTSAAHDFDGSFEDAIQPAIAAAIERLPATGPLDDWVCGECGERVPASFNICWNCEAAAVVSASDCGTPATKSTGVDVEQIPRREEPARTASSPAATGTRTCPACGSSQIIPGVAVVNHEGYGVKVVVDGNPEALIFKDRRDGSLVADVCGDCGNVNIRVGNPAELYRHYVQSQE